MHTLYQQAELAKCARLKKKCEIQSLISEQIWKSSLIVFCYRICDHVDFLAKLIYVGI